MGITHHSNYIRWMEEARIDYLRKIGWGYEKLEAEGLISPVTSIECKYRKSTTFSDIVQIRVDVNEFKGAVLKLSYTMTNQESQVVFEGCSEHCFMSTEGKLIRLREEYPELNELLVSLAMRDK